MKCDCLMLSWTHSLLILPLYYFPVFWLQMSSAFAIIFADCSFLWCQALVCRSGSKDICTLQHGFLCFLLFIYLYFYSFPCIITHVCYFNFLAPFPQIWKYVTKSQYSPELKPFLTLFVSKNPVIYNLFLKGMCFYLLFISIRTLN